MSDIEIVVPDIGEFADVEIIEILVKPGDDITVEQSLVTVESDKASMEIPSSVAGRLKDLRVKVGDKVSKGSVIGTLEAAEAGAGGGAETGGGGADARAGTGTEGDVPAPAPDGAPPAEARPAASSAQPPAPAGATPSASPPASAAPPPVNEVKAPAAGAADDAGSSGESGGETEIQVPDIGDFDQVEIIEVLVAPGDMVSLEQSLITVESDKASMEIPSSAAGKVVRVLVKVGDKVAKGTPVAVIRDGAAGKGGAAESAPPAAPSPAAPGQSGQASPSAASAPPAAGPASAPSAAAPSPTAQSSAPAAASAQASSAAASAPPQSEARAHPVPAEIRDGKVAMKPHASPSVRMFARELGVDLGLVEGSGPKQRITADDVKAFVKRTVARAVGTPAPAASPAAVDGSGLNLLPWPKVDFAKFGEIEVKPLSRIRKIASANLHRNWVMIPHVTNHDDADITDLEAFRVTLNAENAKRGVKLTMLAFLIKACISTLKKFPEFNASLDGESLVYKKYFHIGFAADTPAGLVVPVIKDADKKGLFDLAAEMSELAGKAREGKLAPADMQGGTFSISSLGGIGGTYFTPIINAPEVAILGVCRSVKRPVWNEARGAFEPRLILPLSLSWDHRVIDGAAAARFNTHLAQLLGDFRRVSL